MKYCAHCGYELDRNFVISRTSTCPHCHAYLHACINCTFYSPGAHNDCREPQAERVVDKKGMNFCDFFKFREGLPSNKKTEKKKEEKATDAFRRLFGE